MCTMWRHMCCVSYLEVRVHCQGLVTKAGEVNNKEKCVPQVQGVHLSLTASEEVDGAEAQYEQPDDVPTRLGPTPERALESLCNVARMEQIAQFVHRSQPPEER